MMRQELIRIYFLLTLSYVLLPLYSMAQGVFTELPPKFFNAELLSINDGLSQGSVSSVMQDSDGYLWFTTKDGLNKYDGYKFTVYRNDIYDSTSIIDNDLLMVKEDESKRLWVLSRNKGLDFFDRNNNVFYHFNNSKSSFNLSSNVIYNFIFLDDGSVLLLTDKGLDLLKIIPVKRNSGKEIVSGSGITYEIKKLSQGNDGLLLKFHPDNNLYIDSQKNIWLTHSNDLFKLMLSTDQARFFLKKIDLSRVVPPDPYFKIGENQKFIFTEDKQKKILYFRHPSCIINLNHQTGNFSLVYDYNFQGSILPHNMIVDRDGFLWAYRYSELIKINPESREITSMASEQHNEILFYVNGCYTDNTNNIWISTQGYGVLKLNYRKEKFNHSGNNKEGIISTRTIVPLPDNNFAVSGWSYGTFKIFNTRSKVFDDWLPSENSVIYKNYPKFANVYIDMVVTNEGEKIYAKDVKNIIKTNQKETEVSIVYQSDSGDYIFPLYIDNENYLWFGKDKNLIKLNHHTKEYDIYKIPFDDFSHNPLQRDINQILQDRLGNIWLATINGIYKFNIVDKSWWVMRSKEYDMPGLSSNIIYSICFDLKQPDKFLWIGTNGGGLNKLDIENNTIKYYTTKDGLSNNIIYGILNDDHGNLWMSTNKGLSKFDPIKEVFTNFVEKDGLQSNEYNRFSYCKLSTGELVFGGVNGFNIFHPDDISINSFIPQVNLTALYVNNKPYTHSISNVTKLNYNENVIRFEFASMDLTSPYKNLFRFKLKGIDSEFSPPSIKNEATYTSLSPGKYQFSVLGTNSDGIWSSDYLNLTIIITPPWWATWWFRSIIVLGICGLLYSFYKYRIRQAQKIYALRNNIASDLHDEIGSTLSSIALYGEVARKKSKEKAPEVSKILEQINDNTNKMMESMSDIIWAINTKNDNYDNLVNRMQAFAVEVLEHKNCKVHFVNEGEFKGKGLNMKQRKNLYLIYKEAINNVVKYAQAGNVWIEFSTKESIITLSVKDDGIGLNGFSHKINQMGGNGFHTMKSRTKELKGAIEIKSMETGGTAIELTFKN